MRRRCDGTIPYLARYPSSSSSSSFSPCHSSFFLLSPSFRVSLASFPFFLFLPLLKWGCISTVLAAVIPRGPVEPSRLDKSHTNTHTYVHTHTHTHTHKSVNIGCGGESVFIFEHSFDYHRRQTRGDVFLCHIPT